MIVANFTAKTKKKPFFSPYPPQNRKTRLQVNLQPRNNIKIFYTLIFAAPPLNYAAATAFAVVNSAIIPLYIRVTLSGNLPSW